MNDKAVAQHAEGHAHAILSWADDSAHDIDETARYPLMTEAIRQILVEKGIISAEAVRRLVEQMDARSDVTGGKIVARRNAACDVALAVWGERDAASGG